MSKFVKKILDVKNVLGRVFNPYKPDTFYMFDCLDGSVFGLVATSTWQINGAWTVPAGTYNSINIDTSSFGDEYQLTGDITSFSLHSGLISKLVVSNTCTTLFIDAINMACQRIDLRNADALQSITQCPNNIEHLWANASNNANLYAATSAIIANNYYPGTLYVSPSAYYYAQLVQDATDHFWNVVTI